MGSEARRSAGGSVDTRLSTETRGHRSVTADGWCASLGSALSAACLRGASKTTLGVATYKDRQTRNPTLVAIVRVEK